MPKKDDSKRDDSKKDDLIEEIDLNDLIDDFDLEIPKM